MRTIIARLHQRLLNNVTEQRPKRFWKLRRLEPDYQPIVYPPGWFDDCSHIDDQIIHARQYRQKHSTARTTRT